MSFADRIDKYDTLRIPIIQQNRRLSLENERLEADKAKLVAGLRDIAENRNHALMNAGQIAKQLLQEIEVSDDNLE